MDLNSIFLTAFVLVMVVGLCGVGICNYVEKSHLNDQAPKK